MRDSLIAALRAAADVMRRADPVYCCAVGVEEVTDSEWDDALTMVEDALEAAQERAA